MYPSAEDILKIPVQKFTPLKYHSGTGGAPMFSMPRNSKELLIRFKEIASVVKPDGSYNGNSFHAEGYALCLAREGQPIEAFRLFESIVAGSKKIFTRNFFGEFVPVRGQVGTLGYEGLYNYANLHNIFKNKGNRKIELLSELIREVPTKCYPIRLQDIRVDALQILLQLKIKDIDGNSLDKELELAKAHQY